RSGVVELRGLCWTAVAAESCVPGACDSAYHTCRSHLPNLIVARIGNEQIARKVYSDTTWAGEQSRGGGSVISIEAPATITGNRCDCTRGAYFSAPIITGVGNEDITRGIRGDAMHVTELGRGSGPAIPTEPGCSGARNDAERAIRRDAIDSILGGTGEIKAAGPIGCDTLRYTDRLAVGPRATVG